MRRAHMPRQRIVSLFAVAIALLAVGAAGGYLVEKTDADRNVATAPVLPRGWNLCTNAVHRFAIGYPGGWHEEHLTREEACGFIDPKPFRILRGMVSGVLYGVFYGTALEVHWGLETAEQWAQGLTRSEFGQCKSRHSVEDVVIGRVRAIRVEAITTSDGLYKCGTRVYGYAVNWRNGSISVHTVTEPGVPGYSMRKRVVNAAVRTLYLEPSAPPRAKTDICRVPNVIGLTLGRARTRSATASAGSIASGVLAPAESDK